MTDSKSGQLSEALAEAARALGQKTIVTQEQYLARFLTRQLLVNTEVARVLTSIASGENPTTDIGRLLDLLMPMMGETQTLLGMLEGEGA